MQTLALSPEETARLPHSNPAALTIEWASYVLGLPADIVTVFALPDDAPMIVPDYLDECRSIEIPIEIVEELSRFKAEFLPKHLDCKLPGCACKTIRHYSPQKPG